MDQDSAMALARTQEPAGASFEAIQAAKMSAVIFVLILGIVFLLMGIDEKRR